MRRMMKIQESILINLSVLHWSTLSLLNTGHATPTSNPLILLAVLLSAKAMYCSFLRLSVMLLQDVNASFLLIFQCMLCLSMTISFSLIMGPSSILRLFLFLPPLCFQAPIVYNSLSPSSHCYFPRFLPHKCKCRFYFTHFHLFVSASY